MSGFTIPTRKAAKIAGVSASTLSRLAKAGEILFVERGMGKRLRRRYFRRADLERVRRQAVPA